MAEEVAKVQWQPSGARANPDPTIPDLTADEYFQGEHNIFGRSAASTPLQLNCGYQDNSIDAGELYQDKDLTKGMPILTVHNCMFIILCRYVFVCCCLCM